MAIGTLVVPTDTAELKPWTAVGNKKPMITPAAIARKIHSVRKRSRHERRRAAASGWSMKFISKNPAPAYTVWDRDAQCARQNKRCRDLPRKSHCVRPISSSFSLRAQLVKGVERQVDKQRYAPM